MRYAALLVLAALAACAPRKDALVPSDQAQAVEEALVRYERQCLDEPSSLPRERQMVLCRCTVREARKIPAGELIAAGSATRGAASPRERTEIVLNNEKTRRIVQQCADEALAPLGK